MKNAFKPSVKIVLIPLGLTAAASAADAAIQKKIFGLGMTALIISSKEMNEIMKIIKSLEESSLLIKGVNETTKIEAKEQNRGFIDMLSGTLDANFLGNSLKGKGVKTKKPGRGVVRAGVGAIPTNQERSTNRASSNF